MTCEILLLGSDQQSVENSIKFPFHIKHTGITTRLLGLKGTHVAKFVYFCVFVRAMHV
jgi:hypothetical protein